MSGIEFELPEQLAKAEKRGQQNLNPLAVKDWIRADFQSLLGLESKEARIEAESLWRKNLRDTLRLLLNSHHKSPDHHRGQLLFREFLNSIDSPETATLFFYNLYLAALESGERAVDFVGDLMQFRKNTASYLTPESPAVAYYYLSPYSPDMETVRKMHMVDSMHAFVEKFRTGTDVYSDSSHVIITRTHKSKTYVNQYKKLDPNLVDERNNLTISLARIGDPTEPLNGAMRYILQPDELRTKAVEWVNYKYLEIIPNGQRVVTVTTPDGTDRIFIGKAHELKKTVKHDLLAIYSHPGLTPPPSEVTDQSPIVSALLEWSAPELNLEQIQSLGDLHAQKLSDFLTKSVVSIGLKGDTIRSAQTPFGLTELSEMTFRIGKKIGDIVITLNLAGKPLTLIMDKDFRLLTPDRRFLKLSAASLLWWRTAIVSLVLNKLESTTGTGKTHEHPNHSPLHLTESDLEESGSPSRFFRRHLPKGADFTAGQYALALVFAGKDINDYNRLMQQQGSVGQYTWVLPGIRRIVENMAVHEPAIAKLAGLLSRLSTEHYQVNNQAQQEAVSSLVSLLTAHYETIIGPLVSDMPVMTEIQNGYFDLEQVLIR